MSGQESKKQMLKSTGILGSVQVANIIIGIIRVKFLAVLLGPTGVGIAGIYQTTITLVSSLTGLGLGYSGVRDIAAAAASKDEKRIARTVLVLRRWAFCTGLVGMLITLVLAKPLSRLSFGSEEYAWGIALLSVTLVLSAMTGGMGALLQGLRRIKAMAAANITASIIGLIVSIVIYYFWGVKGIVPALLLTFLLGQSITWLFARQVKMPRVGLSIPDTYKQGLSMAKLGFFMVLSSLASTGTMYLVRAFIVQKAGLEAVGHFTASWTISSMYISAIFGAMGADYFPRLSALQDDPVTMKRQVNEQTEIALLLTTPIIIGMVSFIGLFIHLFYSKDFGATAHILVWQLIGDFFKVLAWPLGFIMLAKAKGKLFVLSELLWNGMYLLMVVIGWKHFDIRASGIAFLVAYIISLAFVYFIGKREIGFAWSFPVIKYVLFFLPLLILSFINGVYLSGMEYYAAGVILTLIASLFSVYHLNKAIGLSAFIKKFMVRFN